MEASRSKSENPQAVALQASADKLHAVNATSHGRLHSVPALQSRGFPPVVELHQLHTARLLPARYSDSVLTRIADSEDDLQSIYALDNATNDRLQAEANNRLSITPAELVSNQRYARIINAAFTHPHPLGARFSTPTRGAWYAGFELATAKAEVLFHRSIQFAEINWQQPEQLDYDHYQADFHGAFHDLRFVAPSGLQSSATGNALDTPSLEDRIPWFECLDPSSYTASQQLAISLLAAQSPGVVYPSTRKAGGTCVACFYPALVGNVRKQELHRLTWYPDRAATFRRVPRREATD